MSRVLVYGIDRKPLGEFSSQVDRGWMLAGNPSVQGGGQTELPLTTEVAAQPYWQFGHLAAMWHDKLPTWAGVIDTPWDATALKVACYNAEYLLSMRSPEEPTFLEGSVGAIAEQVIARFNAVQDMFVRMGDVSGADPTQRQETLDGRTYWEQLKGLLSRSGCEMRTRAEKDSDGRLVIYLDIARQIGIDTGFLYVDGQDGNATFREVKLDGTIRNRVIGTGSENGPTSRLLTAPFVDETSMTTYGMRSEMVQWRDVREQGTLDRYTELYLQYKAYPKLSFLVDIQDKGDAFLNCRLGNLVRARISRAYLPAGQQGWQGTARILAMAYSESSGLLTAGCEAV